MVQGQPVAQASDRPRFRQDLVAEPIEEQGGRYIDVVDPDSGNGFRFFEVEYSLACAMDGERDVEGIVRWATEELGVTPSPSEVRTVIATLGHLGYLEGAATVAATSASAQPVAAPAPAIEIAPASSAAAPAARAAATASRPGASPVPAVDDELAAGVLVGKRPASSPESVGDFELGHVARPTGGDDALPKAPDLQLGLPGRTEHRRLQSSPKVEDIPLGAAGSSGSGEVEIEAVPSQSDDMSLDLSDHIAVRPDDVKEAVRQSRVMSAVDVPKDLMDALEEPAKPAAPPAAAKTPAPPTPAGAAAKRSPTPAPIPPPSPSTPPPAASTKPGAGMPVPGPEPVPPGKAAAAAKPAGAAAKSAKPAVDLPAVAKAMPAPNEPAKTAPPAPEQRTSPILIAIMIVVVIAAAGFAVWKYVLADTDDAADDIERTPHHKPKTSLAPPPGAASGAAMATGSAEAPAPPPPTAKLASETAPGQDLKAAMAGVIETVDANDTVVKTGDVVARLVGHKQLEADLAALAPDIDKRVPAEITAAQVALATATQANDKAGIAAAQAKLADRQKSLKGKQSTQAAKQAELAKYVVTAPVDGKVTAVAKVGAKVAADDVIATVGGGPVMTATFAVTSTDAYKVGAPVQVTIGATAVACTVMSIDGGTLKTSCPADAGSADSVATLK